MLDKDLAKKVGRQNHWLLAAQALLKGPNKIMVTQRKNVILSGAKKLGAAL